MSRNILLFLSNFDYNQKCDEVVEYSTEIQKEIRKSMIPDDYIEEFDRASFQKVHRYSNVS